MLASCDLNLFPTTAIPYEDGDLLILSENDVTDFNNGVIATYRGLHYGFYQTIDLMTECFNATVDFGNSYGFVHRLGTGFQANNGNVESYWASHYGAIKNYNVAIEQVEMVLDNEELAPLHTSANILMANALFGRASSYLALARAFSADYEPETAETELSVPLILVYDQNEKPVRATLKEVYDQIIDDLDYAQELYEAYIEEAETDVFNLNGQKLFLNGAPKSLAPTIDAVKALKARYFLDTHAYADAVDCAMEVIESPAGYTLAATYNDMYAEFMADEGNESIMRLYATKSEGAVGCTAYTGVSSTTAEGKFFQPLFLPSKVIVNAYANTDFRKALWFPVADAEGVAAQASGATYPVKIQGSLVEGINVFTKYIGNPSLQSGNNEDGAHYCKPIMISEMYLIAAEAYAADGKDAQAKAILNQLKAARKAGTATGDAMEEVKAEWFRETVGDGQRIFCIKRWGDGLPARPAQENAEPYVMNTPVSDYTGRTVDADSHTLVWPIPSYEIKISPALQQNPGYSAK